MLCCRFNIQNLVVGACGNAHPVMSRLAQRGRQTSRFEHRNGRWICRTIFANRTSTICESRCALCAGSRLQYWTSRMNANNAQTFIVLRETFEARFPTILTAPMVSKSCSNHGVIAKTSSPCSYVCVSCVLSLPMVPPSVIRCKAQSDHVKWAVQF